MLVAESVGYALASYLFVRSKDRFSAIGKESQCIDARAFGVHRLGSPRTT